MNSQLKAEQIGQAAQLDRQFTVPSKPIVRRGVRLRRVGDIVHLDGSDRPQFFSGAFARETLDKVVSACDGKRDHHSIAAKTGVPLELVFKCLALLWSSGVIEERSSLHHEVPRPLSVYFSRLGNSTGANASWEDAVRRLKSTPVIISGDTTLKAAALRALTGVCNVRDDDGTLDGIHVYFETILSGSPTEEQLRMLEGGKFLRVRADSERVSIGPYIDSEFSPCYACSTKSDNPLESTVPDHLVDLIAGIAAHHLIAFISRATITHLPMDTCVIDISTLSSSYIPLVSLPGCPDCSFSSGPSEASAPVGAVYESSVELPPRKFLAPRDHQAHYYTGNQQLQSQFKTWPSNEHYPLPSLELDGTVRDRAELKEGVLSIEALSLVLGTAFGIDRARSTPERIKRWTASGGNIGGNDAYVILRDSSVRTPGVYVYSPSDHSLVLISREFPKGETLCDIAIVGNLRKTMAKYGTFGFRLAFLDGGCSLTTMRLVSEQLGLKFVPYVTWSDVALIRALQIDPEHEPIVSVVGIGGSNAL